MSSKSKIGLIISVLACCFAMFVFWERNDSKQQAATKEVDIKKKNGKYISQDWEEKYKITKHNPFDLFIFRKLLKNDLNVKESPVFNEKDFNKNLNDTNSLFIFIGNQLVMKQQDLDKLVNAVSRGCDLFISTNSVSANLENLDSNTRISYDYIFDDRVSIAFWGDSSYRTYSFYSIFENDTIARRWSFLSRDFPENEILTSIEDFPTTVKYAYGKGSITFNTTPYLFTNIQLEKQEAFEHYRFVTNELKVDKIVWLELSKNAILQGDNVKPNKYDEKNAKDYLNNKEDNAPKSGGGQDSEFLKLIFSNPALTFAYFLTILGIILYFLFRTKRMRPLVGMLPEEIDATKSYTETLALIYQSKSKPSAILGLMNENLNAQLKTNYDFNPKDYSPEKLEELSQRTNTSKEELIVLLNYGKDKISEISIEYVASFAKAKFDFYAKAGVITEKNLINQQQNFEIRNDILLPSISLLLACLMFIVGFYLLSTRAGFGVLLLPLSIVFFVFSYLKFSKPVLWVKNGFLFFPKNGFSFIKYSLEELLFLELDDSKATFKFPTKSISISLLTVSRYDRGLFNYFKKKNN